MGQKFLSFKRAMLAVITVLLDWTPFGISRKNFPSRTKLVYIQFARSVLFHQVWATIATYIGYALVSSFGIGVRCFLGPELGGPYTNSVSVHDISTIGWLAVGLLPQFIFIIVSKKRKKFAQRAVSFFAVVSLTIIGVVVTDFSFSFIAGRENVAVIISSFIFTMLIATIHLQNSIILSVSAWLFYSSFGYCHSDSKYSIQVYSTGNLTYCTEMCLGFNM